MKKSKLLALCLIGIFLASGLVLVGCGELFGPCWPAYGCDGEVNFSGYFTSTNDCGDSSCAIKKSDKEYYGDYYGDYSSSTPMCDCALNAIQG